MYTRYEYVFVITTFPFISDQVAQVTLAELVVVKGSYLGQILMWYKVVGLVSGVHEYKLTACLHKKKKVGVGHC